MKRISTLIAGMLLASSALLGQADTLVPNFDQVRRILLDITEWEALFFPDGSASLRDNTGAAHMPFPPDVKAPAGSFLFEDIYNLLCPHLRQSREYNEDVCVDLDSGIYGPRWEDVGYVRLYLGDTEIMRTLMYSLWDKSGADDNERLVTWRKKYPLVPGDPPYSRKSKDSNAETPPQDEDAPRPPADDIPSVITPPSEPPPATPSPSAQTDSQGDPAPAPAAQGAAPPPEPVIASAPAKVVIASEAKQPPTPHNDPNTQNRWLYALPLLALTLGGGIFFLLRNRT